MKIYWYIFVYTFLFMLLGWGLEVVSTQVHEQVHVAIFNNDNISSTVKINWITGAGVTIPNSSEYHLYCGERCKYSNSLNEIVSYNVSLIAFTILMAVYLMGIVLLLYAQLKNQEQYQKESEEGELPCSVQTNL